VVGHDMTTRAACSAASLWPAIPSFVRSRVAQIARDECSVGIGGCRLTSIEQSRPTKLCLFCESSLRGVRTREHIFPKWVLTFMGIAKLPVRSSHHVRTGETFEQKDVRDAAPLARTEGRVCATCNNGWMSALESAAMPLLKPYIDGTANLYACRGAEAANNRQMGGKDCIHG